MLPVFFFVFLENVRLVRSPFVSMTFVFGGFGVIALPIFGDFLVRLFLKYENKEMLLVVLLCVFWGCLIVLFIRNLFLFCYFCFLGSLHFPFLVVFSWGSFKNGKIRENARHCFTLSFGGWYSCLICS